MEYNDYIMVTDWDAVEKDDFYLSKEWEENGGKENVRRARKLQKEGNLFIAYVVLAVHYCVFRQMDAHQIFIDKDGEEVLPCENVIIDDNHKHVEEYQL
jgi:hypothetical protein